MDALNFKFALIKPEAWKKFIQESPSNSQGKTDQNRYKRSDPEPQSNLRSFRQKAIVLE